MPTMQKHIFVCSLHEILALMQEGPQKCHMWRGADAWVALDKKNRCQIEKTMAIFFCDVLTSSDRIRSSAIATSFVFLVIFRCALSKEDST